MKYLYSFITGLLLLGISASCSSDFLDTKSSENVDQGQMFQTTQGGMMAINGVIRLMYTEELSTTASRGGFECLMIWFDMLGEDLVYTLSNAQFMTSYQWTLHRNTTSGNVEHFYNLFYRFISNSNMIIANIDEAEGTQEERNYIKGQAYAFRAFAHFNLVQMFGGRYRAGENNSQLGVIMRTSNGTENLPRETVENVYAQINEDLDEAIALLSTITSITKPNKSHIDVNVARGLKARVLLTQGRWAEAADMAKLVVQNSGAKLQEDTYTTTINRFSDQSNTEWIWGKYAIDEQVKTLRDFHSYMSNKNASYNKNSPRAIYNLLYNRISDTDVRKGIWFPRAQDMDYTPAPILPTGGNRVNYTANKYLLANENNKSGDVPWMRLPEMMLIEAEGYARAGRYAEAAQALYPLASFRDPEYTLSTNTGEALIDEIMFQRRVELWGEGFIFLDLKRLDMALDRGPKPRTELGYSDDLWGSATAGKYMPENVDPEASNFNMYDGSIREDCRTREAGHKDWQWSIPQSELDANPLCVQNPL